MARVRFLCTGPCIQSLQDTHAVTRSAPRAAEVIFVLDPQGHVYTQASLSGDALDAAVRRFNPDRRKKAKKQRREIWEYMKPKGFSVIEKRYSVASQKLTV